MARILIGNIKGPKGDTGIQGPQGPEGPQGPQGPLPPLANNGLTTEPGFALDARYGKTLKDQLDTTNSNLNDLTDATINNISFDTNANFAVNNADETYYIILGKTCYIMCNYKALATSHNNNIVFTGLPKPYRPMHGMAYEWTAGVNNSAIMVGVDGTLIVRHGVNGEIYRGSLSYPINPNA